MPKKRVYAANFSSGDVGLQLLIVTAEAFLMTLIVGCFPQLSSIRGLAARKATGKYPTCLLNFFGDPCRVCTRPFEVVDTNEKRKTFSLCANYLAPRIHIMMRQSSGSVNCLLLLSSQDQMRRVRLPGVNAPFGRLHLALYSSRGSQLTLGSI